MNRLSTERRAKVIGCLVEGMSIRATVGATGAARNTVTKLLVALGDACSAYMNEALVDLPCRVIECYEIWSFYYAKAKNMPPEREGQFGYRDVWTWTAIDADTRLVPTYLVGRRDVTDAYRFMTDLAGRLHTRVQVSTDGHKSYLRAIEGAFGSEIDYAMIQKLYGSDPADEHRYTPPVCIRTTRLTNGFSKKIENLAAAVSLHFMHYNFARPHKTLSKPYPTTPAMAAGVADHVWSLEEIVGLRRGGAPEKVEDVVADDPVPHGELSAEPLLGRTNADVLG